ncbi:MAG: response regulator [Desulfobulbaceae bacterium]|nr:response regulator [Desulfobulbaceae bacterium]
MVDTLSPVHSRNLPVMDELLEGDELILLVDDYPDIVVLLKEFLREHDLPAETVGSADAMYAFLEKSPVALIVLDIGLPDADGLSLLPVLTKKYPETAIIMLTAVTDLGIALDCIRNGADDYLTKPVQFTDVFNRIRKVLEKRRLTINNRRYQRQIEQARFRIQLLHELTLKMNSAYLGMVELDEILQAILVGITAEEGLQFNRAFLALFDENGEQLLGRLAIGPSCRDEAGRIWQQMREEDLRFHEILESIKEKCFLGDTEVNLIVRNLKASALETEHILIRAVRQRKSINVVDGVCSECEVPSELINLLRENSFVVVPLYSPSRPLGVIIADHFITGKVIDRDLISDLESFASQASLAIEHCHLYVAMEKKIKELEDVTQELEKNKDLLVEAERYSALGHMAAQLAHSIRNPITSIGGTARMLSRRVQDPSLLKFFNIMTGEATKIEATLQDLFNFVATSTQQMKEKASLNTLIHKALLLHYNVMKKQHIENRVKVPEQDVVFEMDRRQVHQMIVHLIRNSIEAMPEGGTLFITLTLEDALARLSIKDTGVGMDSFNVHRAMEPFYTTKTQGTGMGLALVNRTVKDHGGTVDIKSMPGGGTEVTVSLPCVLQTEG